jgi:hypothetical protein
MTVLHTPTHALAIYVHIYLLYTNFQQRNSLVTDTNDDEDNNGNDNTYTHCAWAGGTPDTQDSDGGELV